MRVRLIHTGTAAAFLGVDRSTLLRYSDRGLIPTIVLPTGLRRYEPDVLAMVRCAWRGEPPSVDVRPHQPQQTPRGAARHNN